MEAIGTNSSVLNNIVLYQTDREKKRRALVYFSSCHTCRTRRFISNFQIFST
jgi:hypothetical protein